MLLRSTRISSRRGLTPFWPPADQLLPAPRKHNCSNVATLSGPVRSRPECPYLAHVLPGGVANKLTTFAPSGRRENYGQQFTYSCQAKVENFFFGPAQTFPTHTRRRRRRRRVSPVLTKANWGGGAHSLINVMGRSKSENGSKLNAQNLKATERLSDARTEKKTLPGQQKGFVPLLAILIKIGK